MQPWNLWLHSLARSLQQMYGGEKKEMEHFINILLSNAQMQ